MNIKQVILQAFHDHPGQFISGEELSQTCGCSRTAVWKHIEELRKDGYEFEAVRKSGYRLLVAPDRLSAAEITAGLNTQRIGQQVIAHDEVQSTQPLAHEAAARGAEEGTLVLAEQQTGGKGRLGRQWHSPKGTGIWMSLIIRPAIPLPKTPQMTLLTAVSVARTIREETGLPVKIKWPNDIFIGDKKVCGILTELNAESDRVNYLVIGIGVNANSVAEDFPQELAEIATSLRIESGEQVKRVRFIQQFCRFFEEEYDYFLQNGFERVKAEWEANSYTIGRWVNVQTISQKLEGRAIALDDEGVLMVQDQAGDIHKVYSADVNYRANP
ncbi:biotin--[acetyl-CoA-carboxylase] ligase [Brevibacillus choshinensis]|uniref:biotin--[acetyl-CoA-carboxylase] ligase n=1 Tax=Brevibacillus choshinensis TaxID=54911 RepID=UPI002E1F6B96|nr:biotin--[acetyl-CoA-carboxylase] ligase [Brevibacillus choshinensis]MED4581374.1 biotin--[acetyl-CoA-carboxylase] ligase [Brevibacillus choshinensis]